MGSKSGNSKTDTVVKLVLIFFISLLSFSVGTFVGKQVSDSDHRRAALEDDYGPMRGVASTDKAEKDSARLSEDDIASLAEEFINSEKAETAPPPQEAKTAAKNSKEPAELQGYRNLAEAKPTGQYKKEMETQDRKVAAYKEKIKEKVETPKPTPTTPSTAATRVAAGKAPTPDPKSERKPDSVLPSVASSAIGKFTVQVASFADETEAKTHASKLKEQGWNSFYIPATVAGKTWYRVSVGLFTTSQSANEFRAELMRDAKLTTAIVQKIVQ